MEESMHRLKTNLALLTFFLFLNILPIMADNKAMPGDLSSILEKAGDNRPELEKALSHYQAQDDSLKLQAAMFLIGNMEEHCYVQFELRDSSGNAVDFDVLDYPDFKTLLAGVDSLEKLHGPLDFERLEKINDIETITADLIITNIDYAFKAWREKPWARGLSFEQFCEYVLPYRGSNEPLENWRGYFWDKFEGIEDEIEDSSDPIEAAAIINDDIKAWFKFDERYYFHPTDEGLAEMLETRMGRCEDMTNLSIFAMRANGLAVTSDYTPHWANTGNNHAWNAIVTRDGKVIPFMGSESNPGRYRLANKLAKAYRKTFSRQTGNLIFQERKQEAVPGWLAGKYYVDVTSDYVNVVNPLILFEREIPDSVDIAYLCVFNSGEWKAIDWARIKYGSARFTDMGTDIVYLPALYLNKEIVPLGPPFILNQDGTTRQIIATADDPISIRITATTIRARVVSTDGIEMTPLIPGQEYELFYWLDGWQSLGTAAATTEDVNLEGVPSGGLYWLVAEDSDKDERIFTIEDGEQVWW
jgi:hypothetical protein